MNVATASCTICQRASCICHQNTAPAGQTTEEGVFQPFFPALQARANEGRLVAEGQQRRSRSSRKSSRGKSRSRTKEHGQKIRSGRQVTDRVRREEKKDRVREETGDKEQQVREKGRRGEGRGSERGKRAEKEDQFRERSSREKQKKHSRKKRDDKEQQGERAEGRKDRTTHELEDYSDSKTTADPRRPRGMETKVKSYPRTDPPQRTNAPERSSRRSSEEKIRRGERKEKKKKNKKSSRNHRRERKSNENISTAGLYDGRNAERQCNIVGKGKDLDNMRYDPPTQPPDDEQCRICVSCNQTLRSNTSSVYVPHINGSLCEPCSSQMSVERSRVPGISFGQPKVPPPVHSGVVMCDAGLYDGRNAERQCDIVGKGKDLDNIGYDPPTQPPDDEDRICVSCNQTLRSNTSSVYVPHINGSLCEPCSSQMSVERSRVPDISFGQPKVQPPVHSGFKCDGSTCRNVGSDIAGTRYQCDTCLLLINLCEGCYLSERAHDPTHEYRKWEQPGAVPAFLPPQQIKPPPVDVLPSARTFSQPFIPSRSEPAVSHAGVSCDGPACLYAGNDISGSRYRCDTCPPSFDLCEQCYQSEKAHDPTHEYRRWEAPGAVPVLMPPQQSAQPQPPPKPDPPSSSQDVYKQQPSKYSSPQLTSSNSSITDQQSSSHSSVPRGLSGSRPPQEPPIVHSGIICDGSNCRNPGHEIVGSRYKCRLCVPSFDLCECCYKSEAHYPTHEFWKFEKPTVTHPGIICNGPGCPTIGHEVIGPRYKCRSCVPSLDLCEYCYKSQKGTHNPNHAFWKFEQPTVTHHGIICDGSGCPSAGHELMGPRYKCHSCIPSFDLCEHCYKSHKGMHDPTHAFWKLEKPTVTHSGVRCDGPNCLSAGHEIMGPRYNCQVCSPSFDLCESCHGSGAVHNPAHQFRKFEKPITSQEQQLQVMHHQLQLQNQQTVERLRLTSAQMQQQNQQSLQNMQAMNVQVQQQTHQSLQNMQAMAQGQYSRARPQLNFGVASENAWLNHQHAPQQQPQGNPFVRKFFHAVAEEAGAGLGEAFGGAVGEAVGEGLGEAVGEAVGASLGEGLGAALAGSLFF